VSGSGAPPRPPIERLLLALLVLSPLLLALAPRDLWAPDEPRYAQVAREALRDGQWLVPHLNGEPYAEKPALHFAWTALVSLPFGEVTPLSARLAGALLAAGAILLVALLARRWFGDPSMGVTAAALFAPMLIVAWNAGRNGLDLPLTFFVLLAVERGSAWASGGRIGPAVAAGLAWGGAILVKGPMGFLTPPIVLAGGMLASRRAPAVRNPGWWLMPLLMVGAGLAWLLPALSAGGEEYRERLLGQIAGRATGAEGHHIRPFWYYAERILHSALPFTGLLIAGAATVPLARRGPIEDRFGLGAAAAGGVGIAVLLSAFATKREVYLIPCLAFASIATAWALHGGRFPRLVRAGLVVAVGTLWVCGAALLALPWILRAISEGAAVPGISEIDPWIFAPLGGAAVVLLGTAWRVRGSFGAPASVVRATALAGTVAFLVAVHAVFPRMDSAWSWGPAARAAEAAAAGGPVRCLGIGQVGVVLWSLSARTTADIASDEELGTALEAGATGALLAEEKAWTRARARAETSPEPWALAVRNARETWSGRVGRRFVRVVAPASRDTLPR
jgi:4-amino-4-deoxy-L-arabinose transferase-like glycosyltransferase